LYKYNDGANDRSALLFTVPHAKGNYDFRIGYEVPYNSGYDSINFGAALDGKHHSVYKTPKQCYFVLLK